MTASQHRALHWCVRSGVAFVVGLAVVTGMAPSARACSLVDPIPLESLPAIVEDGDTSGVVVWPAGAETVVAVFEKTFVVRWPAEAGFAEAWGVALSRYWGRSPESADLELSITGGSPSPPTTTSCPEPVRFVGATLYRVVFDTGAQLPLSVASDTGFEWLSDTTLTADDEAVLAGLFGSPSTPPAPDLPVLHPYVTSTTQTVASDDAQSVTTTTEAIQRGTSPDSAIAIGIVIAVLIGLAGIWLWRRRAPRS